MTLKNEHADVWAVNSREQELEGRWRVRAPLVHLQLSPSNVLLRPSHVQVVRKRERERERE